MMFLWSYGHAPLTAAAVALKNATEVTDRQYEHRKAESSFFVAFVNEPCVERNAAAFPPRCDPLSSWEHSNPSELVSESSGNSSEKVIRLWIDSGAGSEPYDSAFLHQKGF